MFTSILFLSFLQPATSPPPAKPLVIFKRSKVKIPFDQVLARVNEEGKILDQLGQGAKQHWLGEPTKERTFICELDVPKMNEILVNGSMRFWQRMKESARKEPPPVVISPIEFELPLIDSPPLIVTVGQSYPHSNQYPDYWSLMFEVKFKPRVLPSGPEFIWLPSSMQYYAPGRVYIKVIEYDFDCILRVIPFEYKGKWYHLFYDPSPRPNIRPPASGG